MTIQLEAPSIAEFDPESAIELWNTRGIRSRRPQFAEQCTKNQEVQEAEPLNEDEENAAWIEIENL